MSQDNQREKVALGISLALCLALVAVALGGINDSGLTNGPESAKAQVLTPTQSLDDPARAPTEPGDMTRDNSDVLSAGVARADERCALSGVPLGFGSFGDDVFCLQRILAKMTIFTIDQNGIYDDATVVAVTEFQSLHSLHADGIVGRKTGMKLGVWPLDPFTVERTPVPAPGAVDLWGLPLSSVATSGPDAPPLPANSGSGRRLVFERFGQRVWAVDENETVIRSWLVSGSREDNETPGTHRVYSRSKTSVSRDGQSYFSLMVRWLKTRDDAIGFHSLPRRTYNDTWYQTEDELGIRLSSGCQRQADLDAQFTWQFAPVGTPVVVL